MNYRRKNIFIASALEGSVWTRLSFFVMGAGCLRYGQYARGVLYLLSQLSFFAFFRGFALQYLSKFSSLGTETQRKVWSEELQIYQRVPGDNSMLILLYSVLSLAVLAVFIYIWYANIRDAWNAQECTRQGRRPDSFISDIKSLSHERFHISLLSVPMLTLVLFTLLPIIFMILIAFTNFDADHQPPGNLFTWVGMSNVTDIFLGNRTKTNTFFGLLGWTMVWAVLATFTNYFLGMLLAVAINRKRFKENQEIKMQVKVAELANEAKSSFLSNMSHDIRTPLNAIVGLAEICEMNADNPERVKECVDKQKAASEHLMTLINDVLEMSKIESGKAVYMSSEFMLGVSIHNIVMFVQQRMTNKNLRFTISPSKLIHEKVIGDEQRINRAILNIISVVDNFK